MAYSNAQQLRLTANSVLNAFQHIEKGASTAIVSSYIQTSCSKSDINLLLGFYQLVPTGLGDFDDTDEYVYHLEVRKA